MLTHHRLRKNPKEAMQAPAIATGRHPYLLVRTVAIGPEN